MKVTIEIEMDNASFEDAPISELRRVLLTVPTKVREQMRRKPSLCDAPEASDKLCDYNGNTIGSVRYWP